MSSMCGQLTTSCLSTVSLLLELLFAKFGYFSAPCLSQAEVAYSIDNNNNNNNNNANVYGAIIMAKPWQEFPRFI